MGPAQQRRSNMSRPKVPDSERRRIALACNNCKRRKQKCNGLQPCLTCSKKNFICSYRCKDVAESPPRYRNLAIPVRPSALSKTSGQIPPQFWDNRTLEFALDTSFLEHQSQRVSYSSIKHPDSDHRFYTTNEANNQDQTTTVDELDEETVSYSATRILKDQNGRPFYIGDSATLSYLHVFRRIAESIAGRSYFTTDSRKESIVENVVSLPSHVRPPCLLVDRKTADVLIDSFFTNTSGLIDVFDDCTFRDDLDTCYLNPIVANSQFLCSLYFIFAIGLVMATPEAGTVEEDVIRRLRAQSYDQAELFFRSAKCLAGPLHNFGNADIGSVQALVLMAVYMLAISNRNSAFSYHGMAVRSAIALGFHRREAIQNRSELRLRSNMWKSLYILDRFLAASLGRPVAIHEDDCDGVPFEDELSAPPFSPSNSRETTNSPTLSDDGVHLRGLDATVRSSHIIGVIIKRIYGKRRISTNVTQDIVRQCYQWSSDLDMCLRWKQASSNKNDGRKNGGRSTEHVPRADKISVLHVNLFYYHSVILLTRPFFLFLIQPDCQHSDPALRHLRSRTEKFSEICLVTSYHTISMIHAAREAMYLPQRNPFIIYFLFTAALLIMSNEFVALFHHPMSGAFINKAISIMEYFSHGDPQGERLLWILRALQDLVVKQAAQNTAANGSRDFRYSLDAEFVNGTVDPLEKLFTTPSTTRPGYDEDNSDHTAVGRCQQRPSPVENLRHSSLPYLKSTAERSGSSSSVGFYTASNTKSAATSPDCVIVSVNGTPGSNLQATPMILDTPRPSSLDPTPPPPLTSLQTYQQQNHEQYRSHIDGLGGFENSSVGVGGLEQRGPETGRLNYDYVWNWTGTLIPDATATTVSNTAAPDSAVSSAVLDVVPRDHGGAGSHLDIEPGRPGPQPHTSLEPIPQTMFSSYAVGPGGMHADAAHAGGNLTTLNVPLYVARDFG